MSSRVKVSSDLALTTILDLSSSWSSVGKNRLLCWKSFWPDYDVCSMNWFMMVIRDCWIRDDESLIF